MNRTHYICPRCAKLVEATVGHNCPAKPRTIHVDEPAPRSAGTPTEGE